MQIIYLAQASQQEWLRIPFCSRETLRGLAADTALSLLRGQCLSSTFFCCQTLSPSSTEIRFTSFACRAATQKYSAQSKSGGSSEPGYRWEGREEKHGSRERTKGNQREMKSESEGSCFMATGVTLSRLAKNSYCGQVWPGPVNKPGLASMLWVTKAISHLVNLLSLSLPWERD